MLSCPSRRASAPPRDQPHVVAVREYYLGIGVDLAVLEARHAVVHAARQLADLRVQRAPERDVHLLEAAADAEDRHAAGDAGLDERQRQGVAILVVGLVLGCRIDVEAGGMDIGSRARQHDAVDGRQKIVQVGERGTAGEHHGQGLRDFRHRPKIALSDELRHEPLLDEIAVADHPDDGSPHCIGLVCRRSVTMIAVPSARWVWPAGPSNPNSRWDTMEHGRDGVPLRERRPIALTNASASPKAATLPT